MTTEPLTPEEERLLRFARSINGGLADAGPLETIDRLLATLDRERAAMSSLAAKVDKTLVAVERKHAKSSHLALAEAQLAAVLALIQQEGAPRE